MITNENEFYGFFNQIYEDEIYIDLEKSKWKRLFLSYLKALKQWLKIIDKKNQSLYLFAIFKNNAFLEKIFT